MPIAKRPPLSLRHEESPRVPLPRLIIILASHNKTLEHLPPKRRQPLDIRDHVLIPIVRIDDGVQLELDAVLAAPLGDAEQPDHVAAVVAAPDLLVRRGVERVARHGQDVQPLAVVAQPLFADLAAVADDAGALEVEVFLAVAEQGGEEVRVEEGFAAGDVELAHAGVFEQSQAAFGFVDGEDVGGGFGVEAEAACVVAFPGWEVVY